MWTMLWISYRHIERLTDLLGQNSVLSEIILHKITSGEFIENDHYIEKKNFRRFQKRRNERTFRNHETIKWWYNKNLFSNKNYFVESFNRIPKYRVAKFNLIWKLTVIVLKYTLELGIGYGSVGTIFITNQCVKMSCPSSAGIRNLWPLEHESSHITTRPVLPPKFGVGWFNHWRCIQDNLIYLWLFRSLAWAICSVAASSKNFRKKSSKAKTWFDQQKLYFWF